MGKKNRVKGKARTSLPAFVKRPFEGLPSECDVIALRELVPAGTAPLALAGSDREVVLCSLLPMAAPAMVRESGAIWLGLQVQHHFGDPARDLGAVLEKAIAQAEAGEVGIVGLRAKNSLRWTLRREADGLLRAHSGRGYPCPIGVDPTGTLYRCPRSSLSCSTYPSSPNCRPGLTHSSCDR